MRRLRKARARAAKLGRSRGGLTSKIHFGCDGKARPFPVVLTAGQDGDSPQFISVLSAIQVPRRGGGPARSRPDAVAADKAYGSHANRKYVRKRGIVAVIPEKADQKAARAKKGPKGGRPPIFDPEMYKRRNLIERSNNLLKQWRGIATRYDKRPERYQGGIELASALIWLRSLCPD